MINNRQAPRRGRGRNNSNNNNSNRNNNRGGGVDRDNRIDNRARGNAAQMLDKFKKMAQDAQVNDDRVNAEYYLQFADHYFRVNADTMARREEQRLAREERSDSRPDNRNDNRSDTRSDNRPDNRNNSRNKDQDQNDSGKNDSGKNESSDDDKAVVVEKKPVRARRPRKAADTAFKDDTDSAKESGSLDASALPPAIAINSDEKPPVKKAVRKPRVTKAKVSEEGDAA